MEGLIFLAFAGLMAIPLTALFCRLRLKRQKQISYGTMIAGAFCASVVFVTSSLVYFNGWDVFRYDSWMDGGKPFGRGAIFKVLVCVTLTYVLPALGVVVYYQRRHAKALGLLLLAFCFVLPTAASAASRLKDIAMVAGARDNQLVGYGIVTGIAGDGDKNPVYTLQTIANFLQRFGITVPAATLSSKNVAAVVVTADISAFKKNGSRVDVTVASMGDAKTLQGGVLMQTPLLGADGKVYATAQGALSIGGISGGNDGASVQKNHPTTAQIIGGGLVEREIPTEIAHENIIELLLREPDFTSSARLALAINQVFTNSTESVDSTTVRVKMPEGVQGSVVDFIARLEAIEVDADTPARIVINERTGTIVATSHIRISSCAVSHGNITITIANSYDASQPMPFARTGNTVVTPRTDTQVTEQQGRLVPLPELPTVEKVAASLNSLGVTPRDMMAIFQAMKQAGALHAELVMR